MGEGIVTFVKTKINREYKIAFVSTFLIGLIVHLYKFANTLPIHDSVYNYYSDQNVVGSGRWALSWACSLSSYWDLPWVNGLMTCLFISLTVVVIVAIFKIKNSVLVGLIGALLMAAPATTQTLFFLYTADGYMVAMFLAALAVYFSRIEEKRKSRYIFSGVCICVSCGIYQAYVSFALLLAVCYFIDILFLDKFSKKECLNWILRQVLIFAIAVAAYYVIWKLCIQFSGTVINDYQGISNVGNVGAGNLVNGLMNSIENVLFYFLQWNVLTNGFTVYSVLSILFLITMIVGLIIAFISELPGYLTLKHLGLNR